MEASEYHYSENCDAECCGDERDGCKRRDDCVDTSHGSGVDDILAIKQPTEQLGAKEDGHFSDGCCAGRVGETTDPAGISAPARRSAMTSDGRTESGCCDPVATEKKRVIRPTETAESCTDAGCCADDLELPGCCKLDEKCDEECIAIIAAMECKDGHGSGSSKDPNSSPACNTHLAQAMEQYSAYLETARCICRAVLDRDLPSCCEKKQTARTTSSSVRRAGGTINNRKPNHVRAEGRSGGQAQDHAEIAIGADIIPASKDLEKDAAAEVVAVTVDGMTCTGCGTKLERALKSVTGVSAVRVNFMMANAEFCVDPARTTADEAIRCAQKTTGLKCTRIASNEQTIDLVGSAPAMRALGVPVGDIIQLDKSTVRVTYDPTVIGARELAGRMGQLAPLRDPLVSRGRRTALEKLAKTVAAVVLTIPVLALAWGNVDGNAVPYVSLVLATLVQLIAVPDFYRPAILALAHDGTVEMDMLVVLSITAAYAYSLVAFGFRVASRPLDTVEFFETSTLLITLVLLGRLVASYARMRAVAAVSLRSLQAKRAIVDGEEIDARLLQYGDRFKVLPHSVIPTDGIVVDGASEMDESMLTGESVPVAKVAGDHIVAGSVNGTGTITARLTRLPGSNTISDIARLVEDAANAKPRVQDVADRLASRFVPAVASVALIVAIVWVVIGIRVRDNAGGKAVADAITYAIAVLAVSCPCALGLAVPMVLVIAGGVAARGGVVIKSAECIERSRKVTDVVLDKTGTITESVMDVEAAKVFAQNAEAITKALVAGNKHPVAMAVDKYLHSTEGPALDVRSSPGKGLEATLGGDRLVVRAGSPAWTDTETHPEVTRLQDEGMSLLVVTQGSSLLAVYGIRSRIRPEAVSVVDTLLRRAIRVHIVSGDNDRAVQAVARQIGIPDLGGATVVSRCTPAQKRDHVASLMAQGKVVMFVGDGTNDAVAVARADVGVQFGSPAASEVTRMAADVVLLGGLRGITLLLDVSTAGWRRIVFNFAWSVVYNLIAILFAAGAFVSARIPPAYAGLGEIVSVLPVVFAATTMLLTGQ